jgi:hypothetical protein
MNPSNHPYLHLGVFYRVRPHIPLATAIEITYPVDDKMFKHDDHVFGAVETKMARVSHQEVKEIDAWLAEGWLHEQPEGIKSSLVYVHALPDGRRANKQGWEAHEVWGFAEVDVGGGKQERKWVRKVHFLSTDLNRQLFLVWDIVDEVPSA